MLHLIKMALVAAVTVVIGGSGVDPSGSAWTPAFTIYGASITPSLVAALVWKRATKAGAITSILAGTVVSLVWSEAEVLRDALPPSVSDLDAVLPAITVSVVCLVVVSLLTKNEG